MVRYATAGEGSRTDRVEDAGVGDLRLRQLGLRAMGREPDNCQLALLAQEEVREEHGGRVSVALS